MNLQLHLLLRIALVAILCLLVTAASVLFQAHRQAEQNTWRMADSLGRQLEGQLRLIRAGIGRNNTFPDFELWKEAGAQPGVCITYQSIDGKLSRRLCNGTRPNGSETPEFFTVLYRKIFAPGTAAAQTIAVDDTKHGLLTVTPTAELEIAYAWEQSRSLTALSFTTVVVVCLLVYLSIGLALRPAACIVSGIAELEAGHLGHRLPAFELREWQRIATAINRLADSQQQLLAERQKLAIKLIELQENERRALARELHDEFGQCLTAINAVACSIKHTAGTDPAVLSDAEQINQITGHMLASVRGLLARLRPAELDELGLAAGLNSLISAWNGRGGAAYRLRIDGNCARLSANVAEALYRVTQECLTNIFKHAAANQVEVELSIDAKSAVLNVRDDGRASQLPFTGHDGIGLLGMRERVAALGGQLTLSIAQPSGLNINVRLPLADGNSA